MIMESTITLNHPWTFFHSKDSNDDFSIQEIEEEKASNGNIHSYSRIETVQEDEGDVHEEKFLVRFCATNTNNENRYLRIADGGEVKADGKRTDFGTLFEVIHWFREEENNYQLICIGGKYKGYILYMDETSLCSRQYDANRDDPDEETRFKLNQRGKDSSQRGLVSMSDIPVYFDVDGNYRPEGPKVRRGAVDTVDTKIEPTIFIVNHVKTMRVTCL